LERLSVSDAPNRSRQPARGAPEWEVIGVARRSEGQVLERKWKSGRGYALRFRAYGERQYLTLGLETEGWTRARAEEELANVMADVRRGLWVPPPKGRKSQSTDAGLPGIPTFGAFAMQVQLARKGEVGIHTYEYGEWALGYLIPYFGDWALDEIDVPSVDAFRRHMIELSDSRLRAIESGNPLRNKHGQVLRPLSASSINKAIDGLQWVLSMAVEYEHIDRNPATGRRRRLKVTKRAPVHLDSVEQITTLLEAARELDRDCHFHTTDRRPMIATLLFAGLRANELCALSWRDVDLANGRIHIGRSKTHAGLREIHLLPVLRDELAMQKTRAESAEPDAPVFPTSSGGRRDKDNLRNRILASAAKRADQLLEERGQLPLPKGLTPHKLRHTFASILIATGEDPASVMAQLGHTDPKFTLRVYTHMMRRGNGERERLKALVNGESLDRDGGLELSGGK
jgi:integrase